jgi:hypothetical protein
MPWNQSQAFSPHTALTLTPKKKDRHSLLFQTTVHLAQQQLSTLCSVQLTVGLFLECSKALVPSQLE